MSPQAYLLEHPPAITQYRRPRRATPSGVVVVHTAESAPDETGPDTGAENVAHFIATRTSYGSYHDLCDSDSRIRVVPYDAEAYGDGTGSNPHAYHVSAATQADRWPTLGEDWVDATVRQMAEAAADFNRWLQRTHGTTVPARRITREQSEARVPGFISHGERDPGRRSDPGAAFPWPRFLSYYAAASGQSTEEDDMAADDVWKVKLGVLGTDKDINAGMMLRQAHNRAGGARTAANACLRGTKDLALLIKAIPNVSDELKALADDIVARTATEVERLDAEAVAERLEITSKEN